MLQESLMVENFTAASHARAVESIMAHEKGCIGYGECHSVFPEGSFHSYKNSART